METCTYDKVTFVWTVTMTYPLFASATNYYGIVITTVEQATDGVQLLLTNTP